MIFVSDEPYTSTAKETKIKHLKKVGGAHRPDILRFFSEADFLIFICASKRRLFALLKEVLCTL